MRRRIIRGWLAYGIDWEMVVFTHEKRLCLDGPDGIACLFYWHRLGEEKRCLSGRHFSGGSVTCWRGIALRGILSLVWIDVTLDATKYVELVFQHARSYIAEGCLF